MRIFWHEGGLHVQPENENEGQALVALVNNLKFGKPPGMLNCIPGGEAESGSDKLLELLMGDHEPRPRGLSGETHHEQRVVAINKLL